MQRVIFSAWMGPGEMSEQRERALVSMVNHCGCPFGFITRETLQTWAHPGFPIHPLFPLLSAVHQCDYLRCYVLHVYGGGYADIKHTSKNWTPHFNKLDESAAFGLGYTEIGPQGVATVGGSLEREMKQNYTKLVGLCAMIFRPRTEFTSLWFEKTNAVIDGKSELLLNYPARHPQDRLGAQFVDGSVSQYPFAWTELGGNVFHPIVYRYAPHILHGDIAPSFSNYR
jgi:hypothetical protein